MHIQTKALKMEGVVNGQQEKGNRLKKWMEVIYLE
jgi:hypothetical protein